MELPYLETVSKLWNPLIVALLMPLSATLRTDNWTTACKWDTVIPFNLMWEQLKRIIKPNGAIVLFWSEPFSSALRMSNIKQYKYDWVWEKNICANFMMVKYVPLKKTENILVFSEGGINQNTKNKMVYFPQGTKPTSKEIVSKVKKQGVNIYNCLNKTFTQTTTGYPTNILKYSTENGLHPTQKPVALIEYLIKTYTQEWETVLDFTAGSFTTAISCENTNRKWICIEKEQSYFDIGVKRISSLI